MKESMTDQHIDCASVITDVEFNSAILAYICWDHELTTKKEREKIHKYLGKSINIEYNRLDIMFQ